MADPFIGEIRQFAFNFAPRDWAFCDGAILPVSQNPELYSLLGNVFGGSGDKFALPNLRDRVPVCPGAGPGLTPVARGEKGGSEIVTLTEAQIPTHAHTRASEDQADSNVPQERVTAAVPRGGLRAYTDPENRKELGSDKSVGQGKAHANMQPFLVLNYCIALDGIYPPKP